MANSRSISFTSSVVNRCSRVTLSSCCMARLARFDGRLRGSGVCSTSIKDGSADIRVTLVTVVPDEGRPECPLLELSSNGGDSESGTEAGRGADDVRCGQEVMISGMLSVISRNASVLLDRRWDSKLCLRSGIWLLSSCGSDIAIDATANRDSSSEKTTLGRVARLRRGCMLPGIESRSVADERGDRGDRSGDRCVSASCRFSADSGLLRCEFKFRGGGTANSLPFAGPDFRIGGIAKVDSYWFSSSSSA